MPPAAVSTSEYGTPGWPFGSAAVTMVSVVVTTVTVRVTVDVCVVLPPVPVTVIVYEPGAVVEATAMLMVEAPLPGAPMVVGLKLTVTPAG